MTDPVARAEEERLADRVRDVVAAAADLGWECDVLPLPWFVLDLERDEVVATVRVEVSGRRVPVFVVVRSDSYLDHLTWTGHRASRMVRGHLDVLTVVSEVEVTPGLASNAELRALLEAREALGEERRRRLDDALSSASGEPAPLTSASDGSFATAEEVASALARTEAVLAGAPLEWVARRYAAERVADSPPF